MSNYLGGGGGLGYRGTKAQQPPNCVFANDDPTQYDVNYSLLDIWLNEVTNEPWILVSLKGTSTSNGMRALWVPLFDAADADQFNTDNGNAIPAAGILNVLGGENMNTFGSGSTVRVNLNEVIRWPNTTADGLHGVIYLGATCAANTCTGGTRFIHNYGTTSTFIGQGAGNLTYTGPGSNNGFGTASLSSITTGSNNSMHGGSTGANITTGNYNSAFGEAALQFLTTGSDNDAFGDGALRNLLTGSANNAFGTLGGGAGSGVNYVGAESSNICISNQGVVGESNKLRLGTSGSGLGQQNAAYIAGIDGVNVGSTAKVVTMGTGGTVDQLGTASIVGGNNITVTPTANTITISATDFITVTYTTVNTTPYVVLVTDDFLAVDSSGAPITVQLPNTTTTGRIIIIKDATGSSATNNITITTPGGIVLLDAAATYVMNTNWASIQVIWSGTAYKIF